MDDASSAALDATRGFWAFSRPPKTVITAAIVAGAPLVRQKRKT